jgi:hypothetical protein
MKTDAKLTRRSLLGAVPAAAAVSLLAAATALSDATASPAGAAGDDAGLIRLGLELDAWQAEFDYLETIEHDADDMQVANTRATMSSMRF